MSIQTNGPVLKGLACIYIPVSNPYESALWYIKNFNMEVAGYSQPLIPRKDMVSLRTGSGYNLFLIQSNDKRPLSFHNKDGYHQPAFCIHVEDIQAVFKSLKANNVEFGDIVLRDRDSCGTDLEILDPDGNKFQLCQQ